VQILELALSSSLLHTGVCCLKSSTFKKMKVDLEEEMLQNIQQLNRNIPLKSPNRESVISGAQG